MSRIFDILYQVQQIKKKHLIEVVSCRVYWVLGAGFLVLGAGCWVLGARFWVIDRNVHRWLLTVVLYVHRCLFPVVLSVIRWLLPARNAFACEAGGSVVRTQLRPLIYFRRTA